MSRPKNETRLDLAREEAARAALEVATGFAIRKLPVNLYRNDWAFFEKSGNLKLLGEFKWRKSQFRFPFISLSKYTALRLDAAACRLPGRIFYQFGDRPGIVYAYNTGHGTHHIEWGGRDDRGQEGDPELMACFDFKLMQPIEVDIDETEINKILEEMKR